MRTDLNDKLNDVQIVIPECLGDVVNDSLREVGRLHRRHIVKRAGAAFGCFAAVIAAFLAFGFANPALASQVPLVGNLFRQASQKAGIIPQNLDGYGLLQPVGEASNAQPGLTVTQAYSDGYTVQAGLAFVPAETESGWTYLDTNYRRTGSATVNGEEAEIVSVSTFWKQGDAWVSAMSLKVPESQRNAEKLEIALTLRDFTGRSSDDRTRSDPIEGEFSASFPVTVDKAHEVSFTSEAEDNGAKVLAVRSTPSQTVISIEKPYWGDVHPNVPEDGSKGYPVLYTMSGEEIGMDHGAVYEGGYDFKSKEPQAADLYFDGVPAGTKQVILRFCNDNRHLERKKLAEFTIDLEARTVAPAGTIVDEDWGTPYDNAVIGNYGEGKEQNGYAVTCVDFQYYEGAYGGQIVFDSKSGKIGEPECLRLEVENAQGDVIFTTDSVTAQGEENEEWCGQYPSFDADPAVTAPTGYGVWVDLWEENGWVLQGDTVTVTIKDMDTGKVLCTDTRALDRME